MHYRIERIECMASLQWDHLRSFAILMEEGSLSAAARRLSLTQPTLGRQLRQLEAQIGEPLFDRRGNQLTPNQRAVGLYERVRPMQQAADAADRFSSGAVEAMSGAVRISVPEVFGCKVLPPLLSHFRKRHPGISLELVPNNDSVNLQRREADIAVRLYAPTQPDLIRVKVGQAEIGVFAAIEYLERRGAPQSAEDMLHHDLIGEDESERLLRGMRNFGLSVDRSHFNYRTDSILAQISAVEAGLGIGAGMVQAFDMAKVRRLFADLVAIRFDVYVVAHSDLHRSRRIRLLFDHLVQTLPDALRAAAPALP
jgi:DNA-binding transcriptional LysR family regulator